MRRLNSIKVLANANSPQGLLFQRLFWGALVGCIVALFLNNFPLLETLEMGMLEKRYRIADSLEHIGQEATLDERYSKLISIVAFDSDSQYELDIARFNDLRSQDLLRQVIDIVEKGEPDLVVVDLDLRGAASPELVTSFSRYRNVVLALFGSLEGSSDLPANDFLVHAASYGYHELSKEPGGMVFRLPTEQGGSGSESVGVVQIPSLTKAIVNAYRVITGVRKDAILETLKSDQPIYINYKRTKYPLYYMYQLLDGTVEPGQFKGRVVFIGSTLKTRMQDPSYARTPLSDPAAETYIHADAVGTVLTGNVVYSFPRTYLQHVMLLLGAMFGAVSSILPMAQRATLAVCGSGVLVFLAQIIFQLANVALPVVPPLAVLGSGFIIGTVIYLDTDLRQRNKELAEARVQMQQRAEEERKRIAEDLHDETLPALSSIARMVDDMSQEFQESSSPRHMRQKLDDAIQEMRRVINDLHPSVLETMGFVPALENLANMLGRESGIEVRFEDTLHGSDSDLVPDFAKLQLYRIVQEILNNVRKHSAAKMVEVKVAQRDGRLEILVADNGKGIDPRAIRPDSHGLLNIRHRASLIGAQVIWTKPGQFDSGCEVIVISPVKEEEPTS